VQHPSYPAGHSSVASATSAILKQFFPQDEANFEAMAEDAFLARMDAGIHFRSDLDSGLVLGQQVAAPSKPADHSKNWRGNKEID
jgi:membrane-associated phospholipid phosphatase